MKWIFRYWIYLFHIEINFTIINIVIKYKWNFLYIINLHFAIPNLNTLINDMQIRFMRQNNKNYL